MSDLRNVGPLLPVTTPSPGDQVAARLSGKPLNLMTDHVGDFTVTTAFIGACSEGVTVPFLTCVYRGDEILHSVQSQDNEWARIAHFKLVRRLRDAEMYRTWRNLNFWFIAGFPFCLLLCWALKLHFPYFFLGPILLFVFTLIQHRRLSLG